MAAQTGIKNTLSAQDVLTQGEAANKLMMEQLMQKVGQTQQLAQGAQQDYAQAAAAPPPTLTPADTFVPTLLSNIASTLTKDPGYRQRAHEHMAVQQQDLFKARSQNLQALRDIYSQRAEEAQRAGDLATTEAMRSKSEQLNRTLQTVLQTQGEHAAANRDLLERQARAQEAEAKRKADEDAAYARFQYEGQLQEEQDLRRLGIDPKTGKPMTNLPAPQKSKSERAADVRQGLDPDSGLKLATVASKEINDAYSLVRNPKAKEDQKQSMIGNIYRITTERWNTDKRPSDMVNRLLRARQPIKGSKTGDQRYLINPDLKVMKKEKGKWVVDPVNEKLAQQEAMRLAAMWFQQGQ